MERVNRLVGHLQASAEQPSLEAANTSSKSQTQRLSTTDKSFPTSKSDYYGFDRFLSAEDRKLREKARNFAETHYAPIANEQWDKAEFPIHALAKLRELKLGGAWLKGYGCAGLSLMQTAIVATEFARVDASLATFYLVQCGLAMESIYVCGSEEQKQKYLPAMANMEKVGCFGLTEPDYGSDASSLQTSAKKVEGGWILNGAKRWIGNGTFADVYIIWARNTQTNEIQGFIVEKGTKGLKAEKMMNKMTLRTVQNAHITLDNVFIPDAQAMPIGTTFATGVATVLQFSRIFVAWLPVGICMGAYDAAHRYLLERKQFGVPLAAYQIQQEKLVRMLGTIQAMYMMAERVTMMAEEGKAEMPHITLAKAWNTLRGREVVALAREMVGGNGTILDFGVGKAFTDMEALYTYEGSYEVNALVTGRDITGIAAFKSGYKPPKKAAAKN